MIRDVITRLTEHFRLRPKQQGQNGLHRWAATALSLSLYPWPAVTTFMLFRSDKPHQRTFI